jgi:hypothetical protein
MKKAAIAVFLVFGLILMGAIPLSSRSQEDIRAIKKAAEQNPHSQKGTEVRWFKVLVTDNHTKKDVVRISLPIFLVEMVIDCDHGKPLKVKHEGCEVDLRKLFTELKKMGPMEFIKICEEEHTVKIWME